MASLAAVAACTFERGDTCDGDVCLGNAAPVARIRGVDDSGALRVAALTEIILSGADSSDPDGDALSYAWAVDDGCAARVTSGANDVELHIAGLPLGGACEAHLTVTDARGATGVADATLDVRNVGAHVSANAPCAASYTASSPDAQGTAAQPFCALQDALDAAADYQIAEVKVARDATHVLTTSLQVGRSITLRGGYDRNDDTWALTATAHSRIALDSPDDPQGDTAIVASSSTAADTLALANIALYRRARCRAECALIDATTISLALADVRLGFYNEGEFNDVVREGAEDAVYFGVHARGVTDGTKPTSFTASRLRSFGAVTGLASVGIALDESIDATVTDSTLTENAHVTTGIRLLRTDSVHLERTNISVTGDLGTGTTDSLAVAIVDGNNDTLDVGACSALAGTTCGSSQVLEIVDGSFSAVSADVAIAVGAFGTRALRIFAANADTARPRLVASGRQSLGLVTMATGDATNDVRGVDVSDVVMDVEATALSSAELSYVAGWSDGYEVDRGGRDLVVALGSYKPRLVNAEITARVDSSFVAEVSGVVLRDSVMADVTQSAIQLTSSGNFTVARAAGIRTVRAQTATVTGGDVIIERSIYAAWVIGGFIDGETSADNQRNGEDAAGVSYASTGVTLDGLHVGGELSTQYVTVFPVRACVALLGTDGATISDSSLDCAAGVSLSEADPSMAGIFTWETLDVAIEDNYVEIPETSGQDVRVLGVQDGSRRSINQGSTGLIVARNIVELSAGDDSVAIGVRLCGTFESETSSTAPVPPFVDDNVLILHDSFRNIGILVYATSATAAFNSVRVGSCPLPATDCTEGYAMAVYLMHVAADHDVKVLANTFTVGDRSYGNQTSTATPFMTVHNAASSNLYVDAIYDNVYGDEAGGAPGVLLVSLVNASADIQRPQGQGTLDESAINANPGDAHAIGNLAQAPEYCFSDFHGAQGGPQEGHAVHVTADVLGVSSLSDIDGEARTFPGSDSGADLLGACAF